VLGSAEELPCSIDDARPRAAGSHIDGHEQIGLDDPLG
jgi:hypothetical protein